ncbi:MAG: hypothetical protein LBQ54_02830 [Planctomycetaceae bacterium]|nr:hypothetical protein [Planctomycetaceae bacterium]
MRPKATAVERHASLRRAAQGRWIPAASRGGRWELPLRSNNPLLLVAGIHELKNVATGSRMERSDHEATARCPAPVGRGEAARFTADRKRLEYDLLKANRTK